MLPLVSNPIPRDQSCTGHWRASPPRHQRANDGALLVPEPGGTVMNTCRQNVSKRSKRPILYSSPLFQPQALLLLMQTQVTRCSAEDDLSMQRGRACRRLSAWYAAFASGLRMNSFQKACGMHRLHRPIPSCLYRKLSGGIWGMMHYDPTKDTQAREEGDEDLDPISLMHCLCTLHLLCDQPTVQSGHSFLLQQCFRTAWLLMSPFAICDMVPLARKSREVLCRLSYLASALQHDALARKS